MAGTAITTDIQLPNESNRIDARLNTVWHRDARRRAADAKQPATPPRRVGGVRGAVAKAVSNWRTFTRGGR